MKDSRTLRIGESYMFEDFEHLRRSFLDVGAEIEEAPLSQQFEEDPAELGSKHSPLLVGALPPGVGKVEVDRRQGTGREQSRDFDPRIRLHHFQVCRTSAAGATVQFAGELLSPFQRDIANLRKLAHIIEGKPSCPAADFQGTCFYSFATGVYRRPMRVFHGIASAAELRGCALAMGNFDGVHLGHQSLFQRARQLGMPAALTFDPHPGKVLQPELAPKLITLLPRKLELLEQYGLEAVVVQPFTLEYARTPPLDFESSVLDTLGAKYLVVGSDFTYGAQRKGTVKRLATAAKSRQAQVQVAPPVSVDGVVVSSSRVREYILEGRVSAARRLLGRFFDLDGVVVPGQGRGRQIGFPTANVDTENELRPAPGVYAVRVRLADDPAGESWLPGAANIGTKPTFGGTEVTIEVHLLEFAGQLYERRLRVQFVDRLRSEQRFGSVAELTAQIGRDLESARSAIARASP